MTTTRTMTQMTNYKVLVNNESCHGGDFDWTPYLPTGDKPGRWTPKIADVQVCESGWHLTTDPMRWPKVGMQVYKAKGKGKAETRDDKTAYTSVRLIEPANHIIPDWWRTVEAFVAELPTIPWLTPQVDDLPDQINGIPIRLFDTMTAAWDADWDVARDAACTATWDVARAATREVAWYVARYAVWTEAWTAAHAAARAATRAAARDASLVALVLVCDGLPLEAHHIAYAEARMHVWRLGYGVLCDVDGALYCYRRTEWPAQ